MADNQEKALTRSGSAGTIERRSFGSEEIEISAETAGTVLAAQSRAMVEARFVVAMRRPRDWDDVRQKLLGACERPGFAGDADPKNKTWGAAWYKKPVGDGVEGFSIRFAEEAVRAMGNLDIQTITIYDDERKRILTVVVTDLESNVGYPTSVIVEKTIERKKIPRGQEADVIRTRTNSWGEPLYILPATEDDVFQKQQSLASKAIRNGVLRLLPGDIQAECRQRILEIRFGDAAKDPTKVKREISDAFAKLNVQPSGLKQYLGHELGESTPAELAALRELYRAINKGETTWHDALAEVLAETGEAPEEPKTNGKDRAEQLADQIKSKRAAREAQQPPPEPEAPATSEATPEPEESPSSPRAMLADAFVQCGEAHGMKKAKEVLEMNAGTVKLEKVKDEDVEKATAALAKAAREG
jgi:hypothetical protein